MQLTWYGYTRTLFTHDFIEELLTKAGFSRVIRCEFRPTKSVFRKLLNSTTASAKAFSWRPRGERAGKRAGPSA